MFLLLKIDRQGLSDVEMKDILSLNNDVIDELHPYWSPPSAGVSRVPTLAWIRLRDDLKEYMEETISSGRKTVQFSHRLYIYL